MDHPEWDMSNIRIRRAIRNGKVYKMLRGQNAIRRRGARAWRRAERSIAALVEE
jgi:hypothetical protein